MIESLARERNHWLRLRFKRVERLCRRLTHTAEAAQLRLAHPQLIQFPYKHCSGRLAQSGTSGLSAWNYSLPVRQHQIAYNAPSLPRSRPPATTFWHLLSGVPVETSVPSLVALLREAFVRLDRIEGLASDDPSLVEVRRYILLAIVQLNIAWTEESAA